MRWLARSLATGPHLILCLDAKAMRKAFLRIGLPARFHGQFPRTGLATKFAEAKRGTKDHCALVCVTDPETIERIPMAAALVHEAVHVWQWHCKLIGERKPSAEFEAYAIQHIAQALMYEFERQMKKRGKKK